MDDDLAHSCLHRSAGYGLGHTGCVAIHRTIANDESLFGLALAQTAVSIDGAVHVLGPDGAMGGAYHADVEPAEFLEGGAHGRTILAEDGGIVALHLAEVGFDVHVAVEHCPIERAETAEGIAAEEHAAAEEVGDHRLGPMQHRGHEELEGFAAEAQ